MEDKLLSVIIISYNSEQFIEKCITSILRNLPKKSEVIVLDNCSVDSTLQKLEQFVPKIILIKSDKNLGFAKGNNAAVKNALGRYIFFLNPDTEIKEPVLEKIVEFAKNNHDAGIVAPKLIMPNGLVQPSVKKLPTIVGAFKEFILGIKNAYSEYIPEGEEPIDVEAVYGAAMLIEKDLFWQIGGFDERYFLYYEDMDLCRKLKKTNKKIFYLPYLKIQHLVGGTKSNADRYKLNLRSSILYHGFFNFFILQIIFRLRRLLKMR